MPLVIAVTGSIASGKSLVCRTLVELGAEHCESDKLVHKLYDPGTPGFERVVAEFGPDVVGPDGYVDRKILGAKVFGNPEALSRLIRTIGDINAAQKGVIDGWRASLPENGTGVMEAVTLNPAWCDASWLVCTEDEIALRRLMARNSLAEEEGRKRLASQRPWQILAETADLVLHNDCTEAELVDAVRDAFRRLWELKRAGTLPRREDITQRS